MQIRVNSINYKGSVCDGPGIRTVLFLQGCSVHCPHCHNPSTWDMNGGYLIEVDQLVNELKSQSALKRITISGGEPLMQINALEKLIFLLKQEQFEIVLYTSFQKTDVPNSILRQIDYLKTGKFEYDKRTTIMPYIGSKNQTFEKIGE